MSLLSALADNPIARREARAFHRRAHIWIPALLAVWLPMTWVTRAVIPELASGLMSLLAIEIMVALATAFRPDMLIALLLVHRSVSREQWHQAREELTVTFLTPAQIAAGKIIVPIAILSLFHAVGIGYYYSSILYHPDYVVTFTSGGPTYPIGIPVMLLAFVEDVLFATVVVLIAMHSYILDHDPLRATLRALAWLFLFGLAVALCNFAWPLISFYVPILPERVFIWMIMDFSRTMLLGNIVWFGTILPLECIIIVILWIRLKRNLARWLKLEQ